MANTNQNKSRFVNTIEANSLRKFDSDAIFPRQILAAHFVTNVYKIATRISRSRYSMYTFVSNVYTPVKT